MYKCACPVMSDSATLWTIAHQAPLSMGFSRQEYWSWLPFPPPGGLPNPGVKPTSLASPALAGRFFNLPGSIPGSERSPGEWIGYTLQCSWASLVAQLVKNPPAMQETWVQSLGWEDPLEKGKATPSSTLAWRIPWTVRGVSKSQTQLSDFHFTSLHNWLTL